MWIRRSFIAAFSVWLSLEALPASAQSLDVDARINIGLPTVGVVVGGDRQYFRRSPGWGDGRNKRGW